MKNSFLWVSEDFWQEDLPRNKVPRKTRARSRYYGLSELLLLSQTCFLQLEKDRDEGSREH